MSNPAADMTVARALSGLRTTSGDDWMISHLRVSLSSSVGWLYVAQLSNLLIPLATVPYLVRILGFEEYGKVATATAAIGFAVLLTEFGLSLTATRDVVSVRTSGSRLNAYCIDVILAKSVVAVLAFGLSMALIASSQILRAEIDVFLAASIAVLGGIFNPVWLLNGLQKAKVIGIVTLLARLITLSLMFILVDGASDSVIAALLQGSPVLIMGVFAFGWLIGTRQLSMKVLPSVQRSMCVLSSGWQVFTAQFSAAVVNSAGTIVATQLFGSAVAGQYAVAERLAKAVTNLQVPISMALFPSVGAAMTRSISDGLSLVKRAAVYGGCFALLSSAGLLIFGELLVWLISGSRGSLAVEFLNWFSVLPVLVFFSNLLGTQVLINLKAHRSFLAGALVSACVCAIAYAKLVGSSDAIGVAKIYVLGESVMLLSFGVLAWSTLRERARQ